MKSYKICSLRGRADGEWTTSHHEQRIEIYDEPYTHSLTSVAKDNYVIEIYEEKANNHSAD